MKDLLPSGAESPRETTPLSQASASSVLLGSGRWGQPARAPEGRDNTTAKLSRAPEQAGARKHLTPAEKGSSSNPGTRFSEILPSRELPVLAFFLFVFSFANETFPRFDHINRFLLLSV